MNASGVGAGARGSVPPGGRPPGEMGVHESGAPKPLPSCSCTRLARTAGSGMDRWRGSPDSTAWRGRRPALPDLAPGFGRSDRLLASSLREMADLVAALIETRVPSLRVYVVAGVRRRRILPNGPGPTRCRPAPACKLVGPPSNVGHQPARTAQGRASTSRLKVTIERAASLSTW